MATENLQIPDIAASQNQKEVTANAAHNLLDRALNQKAAQKTITVDTVFSTLETRENIVVELIGTPGTPRNIDMPDTNERFMTVVNNTDNVMTIRNSASGGSGQPVLAVGQAAIFQYNGTNFFDYIALAIRTAFIREQPAPQTATDTATLTDAQMLGGILEGTPTGAATYTTRTGTEIEAALSVNVTADDSFELTIINLGATATDITMAGGTGVTFIGDVFIENSTDKHVSGVSHATFRFRRSAANTFIAYRIG